MQQELFQVGKRMKVVETATPAPVGSGPEGETCRTCLHYTRVGWQAGVHLKCGLMRPVWTHGPGTDIKARWPACREWKPQEETSDE